MRKGYYNLTYDQICQIYTLKVVKKSLSEIAFIIWVHKSRKVSLCNCSRESYDKKITKIYSEACSKWFNESNYWIWDESKVFESSANSEKT